MPVGSDASGALDTDFPDIATGPAGADNPANQEDIIRDQGEPYGADAGLQYHSDHSRDALEDCIRDYNSAYGTNYSTNIKAFRDLLRLMNVLVSFTEFKFADLSMEEQTFEDHKSKYLDLNDKVKTDRQKEKVSILDDIDFEVELVHRDNVNVSYILALVIRLRNTKPDEYRRQVQAIISTLESEPELRTVGERLIGRITSYVETYVDGMD